MKKVLIFSFVITALTAVSFRTPTDTIVGRWQQTVKGATALLVFRPDDTFDIFINGKTFTSGKYRDRQDTFALADTACGIDYYGTYKLNFFAPDSRSALRLLLIPAKPVTGLCISSLPVGAAPMRSPWPSPEF
ncbi:hypothetical protein [Spirosoma pollinicola]|uniref:DUF2147 domain-containing protein n=1 Tax=Spirosoma pollinicola TaxID=2057025 RepID=A0A2K8YWR9_9BACT|nr:hypothetical protein [Spirosoma pollinicola]AUD02085.1 hypothetical protein CWM47_09805 [Spirosoma pollinicola]